MPDTDRQSIDAVLGGDPQAYRGLVERYHPIVLRLCRSMLGDDAEADDAAQETFLKAYHRLSAFEGRSSMRTWLYRIASNQCLDRLRKRAREKSESLEALQESGSERLTALLARPDEALKDLERRELLEALLAGLSEEYRLAITLRELEGLSYDEIADAMSCSLDSVKARLRRAREALAQRVRHFQGVYDV